MFAKKLGRIALYSLRYKDKVLQERGWGRGMRKLSMDSFLRSIYRYCDRVPILMQCSILQNCSVDLFLRYGPPIPSAAGPSVTDKVDVIRKRCGEDKMFGVVRYAHHPVSPEASSSMWEQPHTRIDLFVGVRPTSVRPFQSEIALPNRRSCLEMGSSRSNFLVPRLRRGCVGEPSERRDGWATGICLLCDDAMMFE